MTKEEKQLKELQQDLMQTLFGVKKTKRLRPLVKQLTYKGITKKWTYDGAFINFVGGRSICFDLVKQGDEDVKDFIKRYIDEEIELKKCQED